LPGFWWRDYRKTLGLTEEQSRRIDKVVENTMPVFRQKGADLRTQEDELSRLIMTDADEVAVSKQADHVEALRSLLNKNRTLMLYRIRAVLTPDQRTKLSALRAQWELDNQPPPRPGNDRDRQQGADRDRRPPDRTDVPRTR
jgi:Spy/CpxP family protein refolding chaperone